MTDRIRSLCLGLPDVTERPSHGRPAFFRGKRQFLHYMDRHHGDEHETIWCAAPDTGLAWDNVAAAIEDAYDCVG